MLAAKIKELKDKTNSITVNPILWLMELEECKIIDELCHTDDFIRKKRKYLLKLIDKLKIDFSPHYRSLLEEYNEAIVYLDLKEKYPGVQHIPESKIQKTPDFKLTTSTGQELFLELKTLSYFDGNLNYLDVQSKGLEFNISLEEQLKRGEKNATASFSIDPLSRKHLIESLIKKISQNIKQQQFENFGNTVLVVDIRQLHVGSRYEESSVAYYLDRTFNSICSGVLWNVALGKAKSLILKPMFSDKNNIEGELEYDGILTQHTFIYGIIFIASNIGSERRYIGFLRNADEENETDSVIRNLCEILNTNLNFYSYVLNSKTNVQ